MRHTQIPHRQLRRRARYCLAALLASSLLLSGCLYRMAVQQGNWLDDPTLVVQLKEGMTKSQVRYLLGTPMLPNGFDSDRWNYFHYIKTGNMKTPHTRRVTVYFKDDVVERFDRPEDTEEAAAIMTAANDAARRERDARSADSLPSIAPPIPAAKPTPPR